MPRKESVDLVMRRAYRNRDVETLLWSFLKLTEEEIKQGIAPRSRTFSGRDINGFVQSLIAVKRIGDGGRSDPAEELDAELEAFASPRELTVEEAEEVLADRGEGEE